MIVKFFATALFLILSGAPLLASPALTVEEGSRAAQERLKAFDQNLNFHDLKTLKNTLPHERDRLGPTLKIVYDERMELHQQVVFWKKASHLRDDLLNLVGNDQFQGEEKRIHKEEADQIAQTAIQAFGEIKKKFNMIRPAGLQNIMVNMGIKEEGLCWQWAREMTDHLRPLPFKTFDLLWAVAREGTMREHNVVVITNRGKSLQDGLLLDGWKKSGKPRWMRVVDDKKHPWKEGAYYGGG